MERLTEKSVGCFEYALKDHKAVPGEFGTYDAFFDYTMAVKRLGHYEDTGLEPEEIKVREAAKYNAGYYHGDESRCRWIEKELGPIDHLRDLIQAENEGRLVVLPCKVGDHVWIDGRDAIVTEFFGYRYERYFHAVILGRNKHIDIPFDEIGKTVFLTREEAEAALAQKGGSNEQTGNHGEPK